jgi:FkbM family methyltransferase
MSSRFPGSSAQLLAKLLRRTGLAPRLNLTLNLSTRNGSFRVPLLAGATEHLLSNTSGLKQTLIQGLHRHGLFGGDVVDVGVNIGQTILELFASGVPIRKYLGFEPNPRAFVLAEALVHANSAMGCCRLFPWACSESEGFLELFTLAELDTGATTAPEIRPDLYANRCGALIPAYPLDHLAKQLALSERFFFKIDVEGGELAVLKGSYETINHLQPIIQCEVLHAHRESERRDNDAHKQKIFNLLKNLNYIPFLCVLSQESPEHLLGLERIEVFPSALYEDQPHTCDYLFVPHSLEPEITKAYSE